MVLSKKPYFHTSDTKPSTALMDNEKLERLLLKHFRTVCDMCREYENSARIVPTNSLQARETIASLSRLATIITEELLTEQQRMDLCVSFSRGVSTFPRIPWVAIVTRGTKVSNAPSVCICFGRGGNGAVAGLMAPAGSRTHNLVTKERPTDSPELININSSKASSSYNDKFVNPVDFRPENVSWEALASHLKQSLLLLP